MAINFSKLAVLPTQPSLEPRDIFMALPNKDSHYGYPRDVQTEVWKQWFVKRNEKNIIIKMNTGSGKTVVGLLILQSCLNEGKGPAVYIVPDNYLVAQVCLEAKKLGIRVAFDKYDEQGKCIERGEDDYYFKNRKAILVANIHKLVNGKSIFGLRNSGNIQIGSIIIDDVHSCMESIEQQYTIKIENSHPAYGQIINHLLHYQEIKESQIFNEIVLNQDQRVNKLIPFWVWQKSCSEILNILNQKDFKEDPINLFNLPLLIDNWKTCNCVISSRCIEITPKGIQISKIINFEKAQRRIFMSATLADNNIFVSAMGLKDTDDFNVITPEKANDIGERLILFPKFLNANIDDNSVKQQLISHAKKENVVIIVPSFDRVDFWQDASAVVPTQILSSRDKNIEKGVKELKDGNFIGLTVLVNKYEGIDLPDGACRFLVIDGLPTMRSEYDTVLQRMNPGDKQICRESIQKIEQGMGRGVRSNSDYCIVVLMGDKLSDVMVNQDGVKYFSNATLEQYNISKQLWDQLIENNPKPTIEEIFELSNYVLLRDKDWVTLSKNILAHLKYGNTIQTDSIVVAKRRAFENECIERYDKAFNIIEKEKNTNTEADDKTKGMLMQLMAEYKNFINPVQAQEILLSAQKLNNMVLKPIAGIQYEKLSYFSDGQAANVKKYIADKKFSSNSFIIHVDSILEGLVFSPNSSDSFEVALDQIASIIGIRSSRPEKEDIKGSPDNLWAIDNLEYFIIECKNGVKADTTSISKSDCSQLLSSIQWFKNFYDGNSFKYYPIMIHRVNAFDASASPTPDMRIMTEELLNNFKIAIRSFAQCISQDFTVCSNVHEIQRLINYYRLNGKEIINNYTLPPQIQK